MMQLTKHLFETRFLRIVAISYTLFVTIIMLLPFSGSTKIAIPYLDKIIHGIIYAIFFIVWLLYILKAKREIKGAYWVVSIVLFIYGIIIEVLQGSFVANRTQDYWDVVANTIGILVGIVLFYIIKKTFIFKN